MYKVIKAFKDGQDNEYLYEEGDRYPRRGLRPSKKRIKELSTTDNIEGEVFIEEQ